MRAATACLLWANGCSPSFESYSVVRADILTITEALDAYAKDHRGDYPKELSELFASGPDGRAYLHPALKLNDPWGNPYYYEPPMDGQQYRVVCFGADGKLGGENDARDVSN